MNRRSQLFMMVLVVVTLVVFTTAFIVMINKIGYTSESYIGKKQMAILSTAAQAQSALFYADRSAEIAAEQARLDLASTGGHTQSSCGTYMGYQMLSKADQYCMPDEKESYKSKFDDRLRPLLATYPYTVIPSEFTFSIKDKSIIASPLVPIKYGIMESGATAASAASPVIMSKVAWPSSTDTVVTSCFGKRNVDTGSTDHQGIDLRARVGSPVFAAANGTVTKVDMTWGMVVIDHGKGLESRYLHNSHIYVSKGDEVVIGQAIATAGNTAPEPVPVHIHFELRKDGTPIDPLETMFGIEEFSIQFTKDSNCNYNVASYPYKDKIKVRLA